jgi:hypothetical protein
MAGHWFEIACVDYFFKLLISLCLFLPIYGAVLALLSDRVLALTADRDANRRHGANRRSENMAG